MIIRDLEHYEIGSQINQIEQLEGGFAFTLFSAAGIAVGPNVVSLTDINIITQDGAGQGNSVSGFSIVHQSVASSQPIPVG